ncbi:MAG: rubrerythrin family protein [Desulfarculus sp.]|nr:MAG: rubrerythrin family protein [Desulfarculus sp.]
MSEDLSDRLAQALSQVTLAAARLEVFAKKAQAQGRPAEAALFTALAASQRVQARRLTMLLRGKVGETKDNLGQLRQDVLPGLISSLAQGVHQADQAGQDILGTALDQAVQVDSGQAELARDLAARGAGLDYYLCPVCGWLDTGRTPGKCPVCGALGSKFELVQAGLI